jgi:hypothetical protein
MLKPKMLITPGHAETSKLIIFQPSFHFHYVPPRPFIMNELIPGSSGSRGFVHAPDSHVHEGGQINSSPQPPQFCGSVLKSTQVSLHRSGAVGLVSVQLSGGGSSTGKQFNDDHGSSPGGQLTQTPSQQVDSRHT